MRFFSIWLAASVFVALAMVGARATPASSAPSNEQPIVVQQVIRGNTFYHRQRFASGWTDFTPLDSNASVYTQTGSGDFQAFNAYFHPDGERTQQVVRGGVIYERHRPIGTTTWDRFEPISDGGPIYDLVGSNEEITAYNWYDAFIGTDSQIVEQVVVTETVGPTVTSRLYERTLSDSEGSLTGFEEQPQSDNFYSAGSGAINSINTFWFTDQHLLRQQIVRDNDLYARDFNNARNAWGDWYSTGAAVLDQTGVGVITGFNSRYFTDSVEQSLSPPHAARIELSSDQSQLCSGSLVGSRYVLTSAHCFYDDSHQMLSPGSLQVRLDNGNGDGVVYGVLVLRTAPLYDDDDNRFHDLGIIELVTAAPYRSVELQFAEPSLESSVWGVGWDGGSSPTTSPRELRGRRVMCGNGHTHSSTQYCLQNTTGELPRAGNSGTGYINNRGQLVGVHVSGTREAITVQTIANYSNWIRKHVRPWIEIGENPDLVVTTADGFRAVSGAGGQCLSDFDIDDIPYNAALDLSTTWSDGPGSELKLESIRVANLTDHDLVLTEVQVSGQEWFNAFSSTIPGSEILPAGGTPVLQLATVPANTTYPVTNNIIPLQLKMTSLINQSGAQCNFIATVFYNVEQ